MAPGLVSTTTRYPPDHPLDVYSRQRSLTTGVVAEQVNGGADPATVAKAIVAAATDRNPKLRYPAGRQSRQLTVMRRLIPARVFDGQLRKTFKLAV